MPTSPTAIKNAASMGSFSDLTVAARYAEIEAEVSARLETLRQDGDAAPPSALPPLVKPAPAPARWGAAMWTAFWVAMVVLHVGISLGVFVLLSEGHAPDDYYDDDYEDGFL